MLLLSLRKEQSISFAGSLQYTDPKRIFFALFGISNGPEEWSSTGQTADAVGSAFQTAGR